MSGSVTWVAVAAFGLSIVSLAWQAAVTWVRLPRLEVGLESSPAPKSDAADGSPQIATRFTVTVHNRGAESVEVYDLGLESETGLRFSFRSSRTGRRVTAGQSAEITFRDVQGEAMPATIPARSTATWTILDGATAEHGPSVRWRAWAERYRASGKPRHIISKATRFRFRV